MAYKFNIFRSSRYTSSYRPIIRFDFTPTLQIKIPLPGGHEWLVTNEIGGYECMGKDPWPDEYHRGTNYFAIDFSMRNRLNGGLLKYGESSDIPILAVAGGKVYQSTYSSGNGYYVVIDHDGDGDINTGFSTRYLHMRTTPFVSVGDTVQQGAELGYMGNTGISKGTHLHFSIRYKNNGASSVQQLAKVVMDGYLLKSYQTKCSEDGDGTPLDWIRYYQSYNTMY